MSCQFIPSQCRSHSQLYRIDCLRGFMIEAITLKSLPANSLKSVIAEINDECTTDVKAKFSRSFFASAKIFAPTNVQLLYVLRERERERERGRQPSLSLSLRLEQLWRQREQTSSSLSDSLTASARFAHFALHNFLHWAIRAFRSSAARAPQLNSTHSRFEAPKVNVRLQGQASKLFAVRPAVAVS